MNTWYCSPAPIRNRLGRNEMQSQNLKRRPGSEKPAWPHLRSCSRLPRLSRSASLNFAHYCACVCSGFPFAPTTHCSAASCWWHCRNFVNVKCSVMLGVLNIFWADLHPTLLSASLSVLHLGRRGLEALEDWLYGWRMNNLREVTDGTDRVSSPLKPRGSHRGPVHHTESYIKGRRRRRPGQGLSYRSPDIWLSSMLQRQPATPVWQLYALHYCALMRSWTTVKILSWYVFLLPI